VVDGANEEFTGIQAPGYPGPRKYSHVDLPCVNRALSDAATTVVL